MLRFLRQINNFITNWISRGKKIDELFQLFRWIPYYKFDNIEEISKGDYATVYSAIWKGNSLYDFDIARNSDKKVVLKCLHNTQSITDEFLNEV